MYCAHCGNEMPSDAKFCEKCGKIVAPSDRLGADDVATATCGEHCACNCQDNQKRDKLAGKILKFAIMGLAFGITGVLSILGFVFACLARKNVKKYVKLFGETNGRASVGKGINVAAMILSCICLGAFVTGVVTGVLQTLGFLPVG